MARTLIYHSCKSCLLHACITSLQSGKQDYIQLDPYLMCHLGIEPEETVWVLAEQPRTMWTASVVPGMEGKGQLTVCGSQAAVMTNRTKLEIYGFHSGLAEAYKDLDWETWDPAVVIQLMDDNRIDVVRISTAIDAHRNPVRGEWACEQSI